MEDGEALPPVGQSVPPELLDRLRKRIAKSAVMRLLSEADERFQLTQRERITLGALAQTQGMTARELGAVLETQGSDELALWLGRLVQYGLLLTAGKIHKGQSFDLSFRNAPAVQ